MKEMLLFSVDPYILHQDMDCLYRKNIHKMNFNTDFEKCKQWCIERYNCGGFTIFKKSCYFKNLACKYNLFNNEGRSTFVKRRGK